MNGNIQYHLKELEIALDKNDDRMVLPTLLSSDKVIVDIGCGIGQTFLALNCTDKTCIGIDIDHEAISYGNKNYGGSITFIQSDATKTPLPSNSIDLVFSRFSLPYTNIPKVVKEAKRILTTKGRIWITLHDKGMALKYLHEALEKPTNIKRLAHVMYILLNGYVFKYFGFLFPYINGRYESWQDTAAVRKLLLRNGFKVSEKKSGCHLIIEGILN